MTKFEVNVDRNVQRNAKSNVGCMTRFLPAVSAKYPHTNDEHMIPSRCEREQRIKYKNNVIFEVIKTCKSHGTKYTLVLRTQIHVALRYRQHITDTQ